MGVKGWNELGVVGTIYEEEYEEGEEVDTLSSSSSTIPSLEFTPSPTPWKLGRRNDPDVVIHVQDSCFRHHKAALIARSAYLREKLSELPEITLSPPLNITAQTFSTVTEFCYGAHIALTPFNVAALCTAAHLLGMTTGDHNLQAITEEYFCSEITINKEYLYVVLDSTFSLMPEVETEALLITKCIEALSLTDGANLSCLDGVKGLSIRDFEIILESISQRLTDCHDLVYRIIDIYLKANMESLAEDRKTHICNHIDYSIVSPKLLMHAVQNPRMSLRFVVQAMFLQQLSTRDSIIISNSQEQKDGITLGAILERDAALRQVSHLKAAVTATSSRIESLERELSGMRKALDGRDGRASSFRLTSNDRASVSAERSFGRRLVDGIKGAFGLRTNKHGTKGINELGSSDRVVIIKKDRAFHRRSTSQS
ncbi:phototropic-responsive NPH3 family protein [Striga asiatica]|uniref:Phototropic-responsive NPH3 family protein n=1 Tax=Striga asiatica TaxID=4170 RepID=A0A5A7P884_STRAF|nr:phototropic-responsive NPH3 family protein [Striga asiatica]